MAETYANDLQLCVGSFRHLKFGNESVKTVYIILCCESIKCVLKLAIHEVQGYSTLQGFEEKLGLDPNDPIIPFLLFVGASAALWYTYPLFPFFLLVFYSGK